MVERKDIKKQSPLRDAPWARFERFVENILQRRGFEVSTHPIQGDGGFDLVAQKNRQKWAVEVKYYRTGRAQPSLIQAALLRVVIASTPEEFQHGMLVVSATVPEDLKSAMEKRHGVTIVDRGILRSWVADHVDLSDQLEALVESTTTQGSRDERSYFNLELVPKRDTVRDSDRTKLGASLCQELRALPKGKSTWKKYEDLCERILKFLFPKDLHGWHKQKRTDDGLHRYDFVCRIHPSTDFWQFVISDLNSRYALFEFKNYTSKISQGQVLTTEKYLLERGLRRMALIFTRIGADENAKKMVQGAMRENGKFMLILDDEIVCEMLHHRDGGGDPSDILFERADDFLLTLPR